MTGQPIQLDDLNERELEIITLLAQGHSNRDIANHLFLAVKTVKWYITQINSKLATANRHEIVARAKRLGLLQTENPPTNFPAHANRFIGRKQEIEELSRIFEDDNHRLVTILAQGGMGKTRLSLEFAASLSGDFKDGLFFIPLQKIDHSKDIVRAIAEYTPFVFQEKNNSLKQQLLDYLSNKTMLLLLDNFEQLLDDVSLITEILESAPQVKLLVTSRERLNLMSETVYTLDGLHSPDNLALDDVGQSDAMQLLIQAAQRIKPGWELDDSTFQDALRLCQITQGMPLGILLAISWFDTYDLKRIGDEIEASIDFLETDMRDIPERQRSIRLVFEYAWKQLSEQEHQIWQKLSVFRGGFTPFAAEIVAGANGRTLKRLLSKSMLTTTHDGYYDMHELLRQYAARKLSENQLTIETQSAHLKYYADVIHNETPSLYGHGQLDALHVIHTNYDNARAAWQFALKTENYDAIIGMIEALNIFLDVNTRFEELEQLLDEAHSLLKSSDSDELARIIMWQGDLAAHYETEQSKPYYLQAFDLLKDSDNALYKARVMLRAGEFSPDNATREEVIDEALAIFEAHNSQKDIVRAIDSKAYFAYSRGDYEDGIKHTAECARLYREAGDLIGLSWAINHLGIFAMRQKRYDDARIYLEEGLNLAYEIESPIRIVANHMNLAQLAVQSGNYLDEAGQHLNTAIELAGDYNLHSIRSTCLQLLGELALKQN